MQIQSQAFSSKEINGKKLFKRVHGVVVDAVAGMNSISLIVPYPAVKLNELQILWCDEGTTAKFFVDDTEAGLYQQSLGVPAGATEPFLMLNQFGFGLGVAAGFYKQYSEYDADLIGGMRLRCELTIPADKKVCVNFILNELK